VVPAIPRGGHAHDTNDPTAGSSPRRSSGDTGGGAARGGYLSPNQCGFDERRNSHNGGYFVTDSVLRLNDSNCDVLVSHTPGMRMLHGVSDAEYAFSTRDSKQGQLAFLKNAAPRSTDGTRIPPQCYVTIYVGGVMVYDMAQMPDGPVPNLRDYSVNQFAAIEFYPRQAAMPEQFSSPSGCGALLFWARVTGRASRGARHGARVTMGRRPSAEGIDGGARRVESLVPRAAHGDGRRARRGDGLAKELLHLLAPVAAVAHAVGHPPHVDLAQ
jgi:hypothetical protein